MSVNTYLEARAKAAVLAGTEEESINKSIATVEQRLAGFFDAEVIEKFRFGSSTRGTILPRSMDERSDIDYMVVFSGSRYTPQTYLDQLKRFAQMYYPSSVIKQSAPSVVLQLNHIQFDLVPALKQAFWGYRIPDGRGGWQETDPKDFNSKLTAKNVEESHMIKPAIRLVKLWNARNGYIYESFLLEKRVVELSFYFFLGVPSLKHYLFTIFDNLELPSNSAQWCKEKLLRAKESVSIVRRLEQDNLSYLAEVEIKRLIPE